YPGTLGNGAGGTADITGRTGGAIALSGNINDTNDAGGGITMSGNTGGSTTFSGTTKTLNTGASAAFSSTGSAHTITFSGGGQNMAGADLTTSDCGAAGAAAGVGVYLNSTKSPSLSWMNFTGTFGNFGILGYTVSGFTLDHASMTGTFGDNVNVDDDTVHFCG